LNRNEIVKVIEKVNKGFDVFSSYEFGKMANEYLMGHKNKPLAVFSYEDSTVSLFVDSYAYIDIPGTKIIEFENELDKRTRNELRDGLIALHRHNFFYFDSDDYIQRIYQNDMEELPTKLDIKMKFIKDTIDTFNVKAISRCVEELSGFKLLRKTTSRCKIDSAKFKKKILAILEKDDLLDYVEGVETECNFNVYTGEVHYELFYFTENDKAEEYIRSSFYKLFN